MIVFDPTLEFQLGITTNCIAFFLLGILTIYTVRTMMLKNRNNRTFYLLFAISFLEVATHLGITILQHFWFLGSNTLGVILYSWVFTVNCFFLFAWIIYLNDRLRKVYTFDRKYLNKLIILTIPVTVLMILSIVNMFTPVFFSFQNFEYDRKSLYDLNLIIPIGYLIYGIFLFFKSNRKRIVYMEIPFCELLFPIVAAHILEWFLEGLCVIPLGNVITLYTIVLYNMKQNVSIDGLTGLFTRKELHDYLETIVNSKEEDKQTVGILLDLDHFKAINDTYGHLVGDDALVDFGYLIRSSIPRNATGFRYGGDEFIIIVKTSDENEANEIVQKLYENLIRFNEKEERQYQLETSYGVSTLEKDDTTNSFIERMDHRMYEHKISNR